MMSTSGAVVRNQSDWNEWDHPGEMSWAGAFGALLCAIGMVAFLAWLL